MSQPQYEVIPGRKLAVWFTISHWGMFCWATLPYVEKKRVRSIHARKAWRMRKLRIAAQKATMLSSGPRR